MHNPHTPIAKDVPPPAPSSMVKALAGFAALAVAMGIGRFAFTPVLPMMLQDAGLTITSAAWLASANYLGYLIGALSAMALRIRPEHAIRSGLVAIGMATMAMGFSLPFVAWLLLRLLAGVASAWVLISVSVWCLHTLAEYKRPFLNSLVFAGVGSGIAIAGLLCIALTKAHAESEGAWMTLGLLALLVTAVIGRTFTLHAPAALRAKPGTLGTLSTFGWNAQALRLVGCYGVFGFGYIIPATFLPVMAKSALHGSAAFGWLWPVFGLAAAASTLAVSTLAQHMGNRRLWMLAQSVMAIGIVLPVWSPRLPSIMAAALCIGGTFMIITLAALQEAKDVARGDATSLIAAMTAAFAIGQIIGPLTVQEAGGSPNFSIGLMTAAVLLAVGTLLLRNTAPKP